MPRLRPGILLVSWLLILSASGCAGRGEPQRAPSPVAENLARQVLVTMPLIDADQSVQDAERLAQDYGLLFVGKWRLRSIGLFCAIYQVPDDSSVSAVVTALSANPLVHHAQPMQTFRILRSADADPYVHLQYSLTASQVTVAHRVTRGRDMVVAVIDTGVDIDHPDLRGQVVKAENFVHHTDEGFTADRHGTGVAGVIAAADNGIGITGVAPEAKLWTLKACWRERAARANLCSSFTLAKALDFAVRGEVDIINLSLTGPSDTVLAALLAAAEQRGIAVIAAHAEDQSTAQFPAVLPTVIGVQTASRDWSPAGKTIPAPGSNVLTTVPPGTYDMLSGSSLAAAHVSGGAALILALEPELSPTELRVILSGSLRVIPNPDGGSYRVVDICAALSKLAAQYHCPS